VVDSGNTLSIRTQYQRFQTIVVLLN